MFDRKGLKRLQKQPRKARKFQEFNHAHGKELDKKLNEKKEERRHPRKIREEDDKMDWRDILMEEGEDNLHGG
jgi:hypothetical protein